MIRRFHDFLGARGINLWVGLGYGAVVALFLWALAQFYIPGKGLSYLIAFGARQEDVRLSKIRNLDYFVSKASDGYDAQYYVQIAMDPSLQNKGLKRAVDSLPYRGRRILFATTAYLFGLGQPAWILQAFAFQNVVAWLLLAGLLLHWFPPRSWDNFIRWAGILLCSGLCLSVRNALFDGPSLLLIALGVYLLEKGRPWWATAVFAVNGLGKETNLFGATALLPGWKDGGRAWALAVARGLLTALPLVLWVVYIAMFVDGRAGDPGARNFDLPFFAYGRKWMEVADGLPEVSATNAGALWSMLMLVALTVQFLYLVLRPQWNKAWWRIGFSYAILLVFLGDAVWEGYPGAASRVLLPMQVAFNLLVPVSRGWRVVLLLGNLTVFAAPAALESPAGEGFVVRGPDNLIYGEDRRKFSVTFSAQWHQVERYSSDYWCWAGGSASLSVTNPNPQPLLVRIRFGMNMSTPRRVELAVNGQKCWATEAGDHSSQNVTLNDILLPPGTSTLQFVTDTPPVVLEGDPRPLAFRLLNLRFDVRGATTTNDPQRLQAR